MNRRPLRVAKLLQHYASELIERNLEFPGALVTVTHAEVSKKLDTARISVSVFPEAKAAAAMKLLQKRAGEIQFELTRKINIKPMPRIIFDLDRGSENAAAVERIILNNGEGG